MGNGAGLIEVACCELGCAVAISKGVAAEGSPMHVEFQLLMHTGTSAEVARYMYEYNLLDKLFLSLFAIGINAFSSEHIFEYNYGYAFASWLKCLLAVSIERISNSVLTYDISYNFLDKSYSVLSPTHFQTPPTRKL